MESDVKLVNASECEWEGRALNSCELALALSIAHEDLTQAEDAVDHAKPNVGEEDSWFDQELHCLDKGFPRQFNDPFSSLSPDLAGSAQMRVPRKATEVFSLLEKVVAPDVLGKKNMNRARVKPPSQKSSYMGHLQLFRRAAKPP